MEKNNSATAPKQQVTIEVQPEPIQFFYKKLKEEKDAKILERERVAMEEKLKENLTKKEVYKLEVAKLAQERRDNQIALNLQRERYAARGLAKGCWCGVIDKY